MSPSPSSSSGESALNVTSGVCAAMTALHDSAGGPVFINFSDKLDLALQRLSDIEQLIEQHIIKPSSLNEMDLDDLGLPVDSEDLQSLEEKLRNKDFNCENGLYCCRFSLEKLDRMLYWLLSAVIQFVFLKQRMHILIIIIFIRHKSRI